MVLSARDLATRLAKHAEAVCRYYLFRGTPVGEFWRVGDVHNAAGDATYVRLTEGPNGNGAVGHWRNTATGEQGNLLDVIRASQDLATSKEVAAEARRFLRLPLASTENLRRSRRQQRATMLTDERATMRRLLTHSQPLAGTLAECYLRALGLTRLQGLAALRFHPSCCYRRGAGGVPEPLPALLAAITDASGTLTGVHRTWLAQDGSERSPVGCPTPVIGAMKAGGVRFGAAGAVMAIGTPMASVLGLREVLPVMPMVAALAPHALLAFPFPDPLRRLYVLHDRAAIDRAAIEILLDRADAAGIEATLLVTEHQTFDADLRVSGPDAMRYRLRSRMHADDVVDFIETGYGRREASALLPSSPLRAPTADTLPKAWGIAAASVGARHRNGKRSSPVRTRPRF